jgi:hypothetical protein
VWVWGFEILHYTVKLELHLVFDLGCFLGIFRVGEVCFCHTVYVESMVQCGSVGVGACW